MFVPAIEHYYNSLPFQDLCKDFKNRKPNRAAIETTEFVTLQFNSGDQSSNDVLIRFLEALKVPYLQEFGGAIWFIFENEWTTTKVNCKNNVLHFKRCIFN